MSNAVFPVLPGLLWDVVKKPLFRTLIQSAVSGKELRLAQMSYPLYQFSLSYEVLRANALAELQTLMGFFNARNGSFDSFLYIDPDDNAITTQNFGTGDAVTTAFQLTRTYGGFIEPVQNLNGAPSIFDNGVLKTVVTDYNINSLGVVTFTYTPVAGHALTWTGNFYYRVRFLQDVAEFNQFMKQLWELKKLEFQSIKL